LAQVLYLRLVYYWCT